MKTLISFFTLVFLASCQDKPKPVNNTTPSPNPFTGVYINARTGTDTIDFNSFKDSSTFDLRRGEDTAGVTPRPKSHTSFYRFALNNDKIKLDWCFSSKIDSAWYAFQMKGDSLMIGNFYERERKGEVEVFVRRIE